MTATQMLTIANRIIWTLVAVSFLVWMVTR